MEDNDETLQERISRLMGEHGLNIHKLARESRQTVSNVRKIVNEGSLPTRATMGPLAEVLDSNGEEELLFHRDVEELVRLRYKRCVAEVAVRLCAQPEAAEAMARLSRVDLGIAAEVLMAGEALAHADDSTRAEFQQEFQELSERLGLEAPNREHIRR